MDEKGPFFGDAFSGVANLVRSPKELSDLDDLELGADTPPVVHGATAPTAYFKRLRA